MYEKLKQVEGFQEAFPHLMQELKKGNIWRWDTRGYTRMLEEADKAHIRKLEEKYAYINLKVYAVVESIFLLDVDPVQMTSYLYVTSEPDDVQVIEPGISYYAMASVVNHTWDIHELGSVVIQRCPAGGPIRVG